MTRLFKSFKASAHYRIRIPELPGIRGWYLCHVSERVTGRLFRRRNLP